MACPYIQYSKVLLRRPLRCRAELNPCVSQNANLTGSSAVMVQDDHVITLSGQHTPLRSNLCHHTRKKVRDNALPRVGAECRRSPPVHMTVFAFSVSTGVLSSRLTRLIFCLHSTLCLPYQLLSIPTCSENRVVNVAWGLVCLASDSHPSADPIRTLCV